MAWNRDSGPVRHSDGTVTRDKFPSLRAKRTSVPNGTKLRPKDVLAVLLMVAAISGAAVIFIGQIVMWSMTGKWPGGIPRDRYYHCLAHYGNRKLGNKANLMDWPPATHHQCTANLVYPRGLGFTFPPPGLSSN
jgi:hypothetical protein